MTSCAFASFFWRASSQGFGRGGGGAAAPSVSASGAALPGCCFCSGGVAGRRRWRCRCRCCSRASAAMERMFSKRAGSIRPRSSRDVVVAPSPSIPSNISSRIISMRLHSAGGMASRTDPFARAAVVALPGGLVAGAIAGAVAGAGGGALVTVGAGAAPPPPSTASRIALRVSDGKILASSQLASTCRNRLRSLVPPACISGSSAAQTAPNMACAQVPGPGGDPFRTASEAAPPTFLRMESRRYSSGSLRSAAVAGDRRRRRRGAYREDAAARGSDPSAGPSSHETWSSTIIVRAFILALSGKDPRPSRPLPNISTASARSSSALSSSSSSSSSSAWDPPPSFFSSLSTIITIPYGTLRADEK
mmetsp:Transcript_25278/g.50325  ORF Transcript_25278/g.50325 Transcript_25278/m.50325 type:complete len:363 (-) Transcript_25278:111-1199(-)